MAAGSKPDKATVLIINDEETRELDGSFKEEWVRCRFMRNWAGSDRKATERFCNVALIDIFLLDLNGVGLLKCLMKENMKREKSS